MTGVDTPAALIQQTCSGWSIASDIQAVHRIGDTLLAIKDVREKQRDDSHAILKTLTRRLEMIRSESAAGFPTDQQHGANILALDRKKFSLARVINELEDESQNLESQLCRLNIEFLALENEDPINSHSGPLEDVTLLRLKLYRDLGVDVQEDQEGTFSSVIVRSSARNDVRKVSLEPNVSRYFYSNYLWDLLE